MDPDPSHRTLSCRTCYFTCDKEPDGLRVFGQHVCKDHKEEKPSKSEMRQGGATSKRKKCSTCRVKVTHEKRHQDTQGNYLCDECSRTALAKKRGTMPPTSGGAADVENPTEKELAYAAQQLGVRHPVVTRGSCIVCEQPVTTDSMRVRLQEGYAHVSCAENLDRGTCSFCSRNVNASQERNRDNDGNYVHRACQEQESRKATKRSGR